MKTNKLKSKGQLKPLTKEEKLFVPLVKQALTNATRKNPIKSTELLIVANSLGIKAGLELRLSQSRLRKIINFIRANKLSYVISGGFGYYVSKDEEEIENMVLSLRTRAASINSAADGLNELLQELRFEREYGFKM